MVFLAASLINLKNDIQSALNEEYPEEYEVVSVDYTEMGTISDFWLYIYIWDKAHDKTIEVHPGFSQPEVTDEEIKELVDKRYPGKTVDELGGIMEFILEELYDRAVSSTIEMYTDDVIEQVMSEIRTQR